MVVTESNPVAVCAKCHHKLNSIRDKHHRWCKSCRKNAWGEMVSFFTPPVLDIPGSINRHNYDYDAVAALLEAIVNGSPAVVRMQGRDYYRFDITSTQKRRQREMQQN